MIKKRIRYYPVLPFDFYDDWSTSAFLLKEGRDLQELTIGEDSLAAFESNIFSVEAYFQHHLLRTKGSILLRERPKISLPENWTLDELAQKIEAADKKGNWGMIYSL
ncbi:MAG: hypothetical protein HC913_14525 [Microscillaceae bacterium]|nr:hypothetical protein [Microscillaceae bacterium]